MAARDLIAQNIRARAARRGLALDAVADLAGVSCRQLYSFLAAEKDMTLGWLEKTASALDATLADLIREPERGGVPLRRRTRREP